MSKKNTRERGKRNTERQLAQNQDNISTQLLIALSQFLGLQRDASFTDLADAAKDVSVNLDTEDQTRWLKLRKKHLKRESRKLKQHNKNIAQQPTYLTPEQLLDFSTKELLEYLLVLATQEPTKDELEKAFRHSPLKHTIALAGPEVIAALVKRIDYWLQIGNSPKPYADIIAYIRSEYSAYESRRRDATPVEQWTPEDWLNEVQLLIRVSDQLNFDLISPRIYRLLGQLNQSKNN